MSKLGALVLSSLVLGVVACGSEAEDGGDTGSGGAVAAGGTPSAASGGASSGGANSGGSSTGGNSAGGTGGTVAQVDPCEASTDWTCVAVPSKGEYGERTFAVPAQQNWVNTGLYLEAGETATISETGTWSVTSAGSTIDHGDCEVGDLVARIGLHYKDDALTCVSGSVAFVADKAGILFVGALAGNDLGETYETRHDDSGEKTVTVTSTFATSPTVGGADAAAYAWSDVMAEAVEVWGEHVILTLPTAQALADAATLQAAVDKLDRIYELEYELRGAYPHHGQRIRFFPDGTNPGYMLAGNPVRMQLELVNGDDSTRISRAGEEGTSLWGFAHELGHDFSFAPSGFWTYQPNSLESWPNIFSVYVFENLGLELHDAAADCSTDSTGSYDSGNWDAWEGLCFLRQFQFAYGWQFYEDYFASIQTTTSTGGDAWTFVNARFEEAAGENVDDLFDAWDVPY